MAAATMRRKQRDTRIEGNHGDTELRTISSLLLQNRPLLGEQLGHFLSGWVQSWKHHAESWTSEAGHICPLFHRFSDHKTSIQLILTAIPPKSIIKCQKQWCLRCVCIYLSIYIYIYLWIISQFKHSINALRVRSSARNTPSWRRCATWIAVGGRAISAWARRGVQGCRWRPPKLYIDIHRYT